MLQKTVTRVNLDLIKENKASQEALKKDGYKNICHWLMTKFRDKIDIFKVRFPFLENLDGKTSYASKKSLAVSLSMASCCLMFLVTRIPDLGKLSSYQAVQMFQKQTDEDIYN